MQIKTTLRYHLTHVRMAIVNKLMNKKETEDTNKWKYVHVHGWEESASLKCPYYPKQSIHSA